MSGRVRHRGVAAAAAALLAAGAAVALTGADPAGAETPPSCHGETATILGTDGRDELVGTPGRDVIVALGGPDVVRARGGSDVVCGGDGADDLGGGRGPDRLYGGRDGRGADRAGVYLVGDLLRGGPGDDLLVMGVDDRRGHKPPDTVSYDHARRAVVVDLSGDGDGTASGQGSDRIVRSTQVAVVGSAYDDTITGSAADDQLVGGPGDDTVSGGDGDDVLSGDVGLGPDFAVGGGPVGTSSDDDVVHGDPGADLLLSARGHDQLFGDDGNDAVVVSGTDATDVEGGDGLDAVEQVLATESGGSTDGGPGFDYLTVLGTPYDGTSPRPRYTLDLRTGTTAVDADPAVTGTVGGYEEYRLQGRLRWRFFGTPGNDRVWALSGGPLRASTYAGDDWIIGTARADTLDGGAGTDEADGREGADTCRHVELATDC